jgi:thioredoxin-related protein
MKKIGLLLLLISSMYAKSLPFLDNYDEAMKVAKKEKKDVMLVVVSTTCPWCRRYKQKTLTNSSVQKAILDNYIVLMLNKDIDEMRDDLRARLVPTTFFLDSSGEEFYSAIGYRTVKQLKIDLVDAQDIKNMEDIDIDEE